MPRDPLHVVAGILSDADGRVLLAQRLAGTHLAGTWEFPGGKIETGEDAASALRRELHEELGVDVGAVEPLIAVPWSYADKSIVLHAYRVRDFRGEPRGLQQQALQWLAVDDLAATDMPPADRPIVTALRLPQEYAVTPDLADAAALLARVASLAASGRHLIQLRSKSLPSDRLGDTARAAAALARRHGSTLLLNGDVALARALDLDGVHLPAHELLRLDARPLPARRWVAASCHDARELAHAAAIGVDFAVLGPVHATASHPGAPALGWRRFADLCAQAPFPVYGIGGMALGDLPDAVAAGAQGIAGISAFAA